MSASTKKKARPAKPSSAKKKTKAKAAKPKKVEKKAPAAAAAEEKPKKVAPKAKKAAEKKVAAPKTTEKKQMVKLGPPPIAMVASRHIDSLHQRVARGFSFGELASAGVPLDTAKRQDLSVDVRRRSVVHENVEKLKGWFKHPGHAAAREGAVKPVTVAAVAKKK